MHGEKGDVPVAYPLPDSAYPPREHSRSWVRICVSALVSYSGWLVGALIFGLRSAMTAFLASRLLDWVGGFFAASRRTAVPRYIGSPVPSHRVGEMTNTETVKSVQHPKASTQTSEPAVVGAKVTTSGSKFDFRSIFLFLISLALLRIVPTVALAYEPPMPLFHYLLSLCLFFYSGYPTWLLRTTLRWAFAHKVAAIKVLLALAGCALAAECTYNWYRSMVWAWEMRAQNEALVASLRMLDWAEEMGEVL